MSKVRDNCVSFCSGSIKEKDMTTAEYTKSQGMFLHTATKSLRGFARMNNEEARVALDARYEFTHQLWGTPMEIFKRQR